MPENYQAIKSAGGEPYRRLLERKSATRKLYVVRNHENVLERDREIKSLAYKANPEKYRARKRENYQKNPELFVERSKKWRRDNPQKAAEKDRRDSLRRDREEERKRERTRRYGLTPDAFDSIFSRQEGKCAICDAILTQRAHIDHCHLSGKVRGLLCGSCNSGIGMLRDDPHLIRKAVEYLENFHAE